MCDIIEECIVGDKPGISVYDMCFGDYQYLLQKLRIATYGPEYKIVGYCPHCGAENPETINLGEMELRTLGEQFADSLMVDLPVTGKRVEMRLQTPRALDDIAIKRKDLMKKQPLMDSDPTLMFTLKSLIYKIDGETPEFIRLENMIRQLPMRDSNKILNAARKLNDMIGYNMSLHLSCQECGLDYNSTFRITSEFFGPTED